MNIKEKAFTLIELLAVVVILSIILVIVVPKINEINENGRKRALSASIRQIANAAENMKLENDTLGIKKEILCEELIKTDNQFLSCFVSFNDEGKAEVTLIGSGKFKGYKACNSTKDNVLVLKESGTCGGEYNITYELNNLSNTLTWDGNIIGLENVENSLYKVSDIVITEDMLADGYSITMYSAENGLSQTATQDDVPYEKVAEDIISIAEMSVLLVTSDIEEEGISYSKGIYFVKQDSMWVTNFKINNHELFEKTNIKFSGDSIFWNGNSDGLENIENTIYKVSDIVITEDILSNGFSITGYDLETGMSDIATQDDVSYEKTTDDIITIAGAMVWLVINDTEIEGITLSKGIYFYHDTSICVTKFQINGYTGFIKESLNPSTYRTSNATIVLKNPTKEGYEFIGWTGSNGNIPELEVTIPKGSVGDKHFIANWKKENTAWAIYSEDDQSLTFVKNDLIYKEGDEFIDQAGNKKTITKAYTDFENRTFSIYTAVPWHERRQDIVSVSFEDEIKPISTAVWFYQFDSLTSIDLSNLNTSKVTDMSFMFALSTIENIDLSVLDTSEVTSMVGMFYGCRSTTTIDLTEINTSKVKNMNGMFSFIKSDIELIGISLLDTSNVTDMGQMFYGLWIDELDLSKWDTSKVINMSNMFEEARILSLDLSGFDTRNVTDMSLMFNMFYTEKLDLSSFDTSKVTDMSRMFSSCFITTGYARTQTDADKFNDASITSIPTELRFIVKQ